MTHWNEIRFPAREDRVWELYHENSKSPVFNHAREVAERLTETLETLHVSLPVHGQWEKKLTHRKSMSLLVKMDTNSGEDRMERQKTLSFEQLSAIMHFAADRGKEKAGRKYAFLPLEVFGFAHRVEGMPSGLFHLDWKDMTIRVIHGAQDHMEFTGYLHDTVDARMWIFITALFQRSALIFGEKGYRFAVSESGRMAQNILLASNALGLSSQLEMQYCERKIETFIGIDGVDHALLQVVGL